MANNPNPNLISDPTWRLWEETAADTPGIRLGGIFANKKCYHNSVKNNLRFWPGGYCIKLLLDLVQNNRDFARAIDWTMSNAEMIKRTNRLRASALDPDDDRLFAMREFIGTRDGDNVYCLIKDDEDGPWRFDGSRDSTHLWHIHGSFFTKFINDWKALAGIVSVWIGETYAKWKERQAGGNDVVMTVPDGSPMLRRGSTGTAVRRLQEALDFVGINTAVDGDFGPNTETSVKTFQSRANLGVDGIYGPNTAQALQREVNMGIFEDVWFPDKIPSPAQDPGRATNKFWAPSNVIRSNNDHARLDLAETRALAKASKIRDEAILDAVRGLDTAAIMARIDAVAEKDIERDAALLELILAGQSGALDAAEVVRQMGELMSAAVPVRTDT